MFGKESKSWYGDIVDTSDLTESFMALLVCLTTREMESWAIMNFLFYHHSKARMLSMVCAWVFVAIAAICWCSGSSAVAALVNTPPTLTVAAALSVLPNKPRDAGWVPLQGTTEHQRRDRKGWCVYWGNYSSKKQTLPKLQFESSIENATSDRRNRAGLTKTALVSIMHLHLI